MYNPAVTYASCNTTNWVKDWYGVVSKQSSENTNPALVLVLLCFPICEIGEIAWKGTAESVKFIIVWKVI